MKIGIGSPAAIPWVKAQDIMEWARRADAGPFSSIGIIDRLVYQNYDPLIALTAAAAVTRRIRLMTTILLAPLRNPAILAKQAASLDALSGGRLTLGLGVGAREEDFRAAEVPFEHRGTRMVKMIERMKKIWSGEPLEPGMNVIGPKPARPGGPELLLGGNSEAAVRRVGRLADGFISSGGADPQRSYQLYQAAAAAWEKAGRPGKPRYVSAIYFALGPEDVVARGNEYMASYYGPGRTAQSSPNAIRDLMKAYADVGVDELILWASVPDPDQVYRAADLAAKFVD
jgi:alkanesulfonate monooxygenase SsuD/methylene tetrahydromethanopterin reductase-like flavin-dependent oxidoreductase (luciferase family)